MPVLQDKDNPLLTLCGMHAKGYAGLNLSGQRKRSGQNHRYRLDAMTGSAAFKIDDKLLSAHIKGFVTLQRKLDVKDLHELHQLGYIRLACLNLYWLFVGLE